MPVCCAGDNAEEKAEDDPLRECQFFHAGKVVISTQYSVVSSREF